MADRISRKVVAFYICRQGLKHAVIETANISGSPADNYVYEFLQFRIQACHLAQT